MEITPMPARQAFTNVEAAGVNKGHGALLGQMLARATCMVMGREAATCTPSTRRLSEALCSRSRLVYIGKRDLLRLVIFAIVSLDRITLRFPGGVSSDGDRRSIHFEAAT